MTWMNCIGFMMGNNSFRQDTLRFNELNFQIYKNINMKNLRNKLAQFKQWILSIVIGRFRPKFLKYDEIKGHYGKNDLIASLNDGRTYKYSGSLTLVGIGKKAEGYDSHNNALVVYKGGKIASVIEKGIDHEHIKQMQHIENVLSTCKRLGCTPTELLHKDYMNELGHS